jgi:riboflavin kinase/FMN adenylyltransferase
VQRWRGLDEVPSGWGQSVVTIGVFDGVHRGQRQLIGTAVDKAQAMGLPSVVVTFDPHPSEVVRPGTHPAQLTTTRYKAELLESIGVDVVLVLPFTLALSHLEPDAFVHEVLVERLQAAAVVVGENFRFGFKAAGDVTLLKRLGARFGFTAEAVPMVLAAGDTAYSSTLIRKLVAAGDVTAAAEALCRDHRVEGVVVRGDQRGRQIGYPTANLRPVPHAAVPADGIYAGWLIPLAPSGERRAAAISVGTNPTFEGRQRRVEAYVLDFDGDLYGDRVGIDFTRRLRPMERYETVEQLLEQMAIDVRQTRELLLG